VRAQVTFEGRNIGQGKSNLAVCAMNKSIGIQLIVYSLLLAGLSYLVHHLSPALARPTLITGLIGGALCLVWGARAVAGSQGRALPILTLIPVSFVMLSQTVIVWTGGSEEVTGRRGAAVVITVLLALSLGMVMRIAYTGLETYGQPTNAAKETGANPGTTGKGAV
jgi:hypothetical protein